MATSARWALRALSILCILTSHSLSRATTHSQCVEVFDKSPNHAPLPLADIETDRNERAIMPLLQRLQENWLMGVVEGEIMSQRVVVPLSPERRQHWPEPEISFSAGLMAPLGQLFELRPDPVSGRIHPIVNPEEHQRILQLTEERLKELPTSLDTEFEQALNQVASVREISPGVVMVSVDNFTSSSDERARSIRGRLTVYYINLVSWVYRAAGLEPNQTLTSLRMLDEIAMYAKDGFYFKFHMVFDASTWAIQKRDLQKFWTDQANGASADTPPLLPFLPFSGAVTAEPIPGNHKPVELKRYFRNPYEDPLALAETHKKNEYILRYRMLYNIVAQLPSGTEIEIHAHQEVQAMLYQKFGFNFARFIENEKYPGAKVWLLKGKRESVLETTAAFLKRMTQAGSGDH